MIIVFSLRIAISFHGYWNLNPSSKIGTPRKLNHPQYSSIRHTSKDLPKLNTDHDLKSTCFHYYSWLVHWRSCFTLSLFWSWCEFKTFHIQSLKLEFEPWTTCANSQVLNNTTTTTALLIQTLIVFCKTVSHKPHISIESVIASMQKKKARGERLCQIGVFTIS